MGQPKRRSALCCRPLLAALALKNPMSDIEFKLMNWRGGNVSAERLACALLHLEGFTSVDPQEIET